MTDSKKLSDKQIKELQDVYLNKKIKISTPKQQYVGVCNFIGYNSFLPDWGLQVTMDRFPITNLELYQIELA